MHTHMSLFKGERNAFYNAKAKDHLSSRAKQYIAGLLEHASEMTLITNQWVNSYKRLVPGYEAPIYKTWATGSRSDLVRVPAYKPGKESAVRVEYRSPDPACNPYLAFAVMLAAGLEGVDKKYKLPAANDRDLAKMDEEAMKQANIGTLPRDLSQAIDAAEGSKVLRKALGDHVFEKYIENKKIEWENFRAQVTTYELEQSLKVL